MKYLMFVMMLTGSLASFASDLDGETYFLNSKEFKSMPQEQQAKYLKSLQKIMAVMAKQTLYMASGSGKENSRLPANATGKSVDELLEAQIRKNFDMAMDSFADVSGEGFSFRENQKVKTSAVTSTEVQSKPLPPLPPAAPASAASAPAAQKPASAAAATIAAKPTAAASAPSAPSSAAAAAKPTATASAPAAPASAAKSETATAVLEKPKATVSDAEAKPTAAKNDKKPASKETDVITETKDGKIVGGKEIVNESTASKKSKRAHFRCMYSGWVVEKDPCKAQPTFPDSYSIKGVDKAKMVCGAKETMCNPTLFGLRLPKECKKLSDCATDAVPLCVLKGAWPTEDCYNLSTYQDTLVAAEIASSDSAQYDRFTQNFADLCDKDQIKTNPFAEPNNRANRRVSPEGVRRDIEITCSWAKKKMKDTTEAYRIASVVNGGKAPASSDKAAQPSTEKPNGQK